MESAIESDDTTVIDITRSSTQAQPELHCSWSNPVDTMETYVIEKQGAEESTDVDMVTLPPRSSSINDTNSPSDTTSSQKTSFILLRDILIHTFIASSVCAPVCMAVHKYALYELYTNDMYHNMTYEEFQPGDKARFTLCGDILFYCMFVLLQYHILVSMLENYDYPNKKIYATIVGVVSLILVGGEEGVWEFFISPSVHQVISPCLIAAVTSSLFVIVCLAARHQYRQEEGRNDANVFPQPVKEIAYTGIAVILGAGYIRLVSVVDAYRKSDAFRWTTPFVIPVAGFIVRYRGIRSNLRETSVAKLSLAITASSSVLSRISQCAFLSNTLDGTDFTMFLVMELFYDVVGVIIRVTLYHRQLILDTLMRGKISSRNWRDVLSQNNKQQSPRCRLVSSVCVVQGEIAELTSFLALWATRVSLIPTSELDSEFIGKLVSVFFGGIIFQMVCYHVTNVLVRKVEAVPIEELDMDIRPLKLLWSTQQFYISLILLFLGNATKYLYEAWFQVTQRY
eukprot:PhF_6_TR25795/c1_g2_i6/m.36394